MKTYYVKSRTGEIRPLTTKAYIVSSLRADLISVKSLNHQGYRVVHDPDPEESGIYPIFDGKIDKSIYLSNLRRRGDVYAFFLV